jgi:hypothetical protein
MGSPAPVSARRQRILPRIAASADRVGRVGARRLGAVGEKEGDRGADHEHVEDDRGGGGRGEAAVALEHPAHDRRDAHQGHVGQRQHDEPEREGPIGIMPGAEQHDEQGGLAEDEERAGEQRQPRQRDGRESVRQLSVVLHEQRVFGQERRGERALAEEAAEEVGDGPRGHERRPDSRIAHEAGVHQVAGEPGEA